VNRNPWWALSIFSGVAAGLLVVIFTNECAYTSGREACCKSRGGLLIDGQCRKVGEVVP
jgi:hypothetical protein